MLRTRLTKWILMLPILVYTAFSAGPYLWTAIMSLRTTDEIYRSHYGLPIPAHWGKFYVAWTEFGYHIYFRNSAIVAVTAVILITIVGALAGFGFARALLACARATGFAVSAGRLRAETRVSRAAALTAFTIIW